MLLARLHAVFSVAGSVSPNTRVITNKTSRHRSSAGLYCPSLQRANAKLLWWSKARCEGRDGPKQVHVSSQHAVRMQPAHVMQKRLASGMSAVDGRVDQRLPATVPDRRPPPAATVTTVGGLLHDVARRCTRTTTATALLLVHSHMVRYVTTLGKLCRRFMICHCLGRISDCFRQGQHTALPSLQGQHTALPSLQGQHTANDAGQVNDGSAVQTCLSRKKVWILRVGPFHACDEGPRQADLHLAREVLVADGARIPT